MMLPATVFEQQLHCAATWLLTGVIWTVQLVHYPMFAGLRAGDFSESHAFHSRRIAWVVGPAMIVELALASRLWFRAGLTDPAAASGSALVAVVWIVTALRMIPLHERFRQSGFQPELLRSLLRWNWVRTAAWSARALFCLLLPAAH